MANLFKKNVPHRFCEDDAEPYDERHSALQEVILSGSDFIHRSKQDFHGHYAELVIHANRTTYNMDNLVETLHDILNMYNKIDDCPCWRTFAWRKFSTSFLDIVAVSIEKLCKAK